MKHKHLRLIAKKLSKELTWGEKLKFFILLMNPRFLKEYKEYKFVWKDIEKYAPYPDVNVSHEKKYSRLIIYSAAASILLLIGIIGVFRQRVQKVYNRSQHSLTYILPDSSKVVLDKGAVLEYHTNLWGRFDRKVYIQGQAFFDVRKLNGSRFVVKTEDLSISVLGTKFNVLSNSELTEVTLVEGKVELTDFKHLDTTVILHPNQIAYYDLKKREVIVSDINPNVSTYWLDNRLYFSDFKLKDIALILRKYYGKILIFDDSLLKEKQIGGSAPTDDPELIIKALSYITNSTYIRRGDTVYFKSKQKK